MKHRSASSSLIKWVRGGNQAFSMTRQCCVLSTKSQAALKSTKDDVKIRWQKMTLNFFVLFIFLSFGKKLVSSWSVRTKSTIILFYGLICMWKKPYRVQLQVPCTKLFKLLSPNMAILNNFYKQFKKKRVRDTLIC